MSNDGGDSVEKRKRMSTGLYVSCPPHIKGALETALDFGYHFIVSQITHPNFARDLQKYQNENNRPLIIGRTDRILKSTEWNRLIVAELSPSIDVDSEILHIHNTSKALLNQELGFASHLSVPAILLSLTKPRNVQLARILHDKLTCGTVGYSIWINMPMVHPSRFSPLADDAVHDTWTWWNDFRTFCNYDKRLGVVLEMPDVKHVPPFEEIDRWIGEPVKAIVIPTSHFLINQFGKPVLTKMHQEIVRRFMGVDVQYVIKDDGLLQEDISLYIKYLSYLGKKLYLGDVMAEYVQGCEDFLQNPLQPLTEHLETTIYEVFEKDQIKYDTYQNAICKALQDLKTVDNKDPVIMVVGAGRGPLVQAVLNVSYTLHKKIKVYAIEKNPYAMNTLIDRVNNEWNNKVVLIHEDMRTYEPPEKADILISELLGSFGDNELSPECLDGAQRFLNKSTGISIPYSYTSYLAPIQSIKIFNEIRANRVVDKTLTSCYETPYVVHLSNYYQIDAPQELFKFIHPNWNETINNERYKRLTFKCSQSCVLTGFAGFFDTILYKDVFLSTHPDTHTANMVSWFPIVFLLNDPVQVEEGSNIVIAFWRAESHEKVWYEWCLEEPIKTSILNPNGRSYFIKKH